MHVDNDVDDDEKEGIDALMTEMELIHRRDNCERCRRRIPAFKLMAHRCDERSLTNRICVIIS